MEVGRCETFDNGQAIRHEDSAGIGLFLMGLLLQERIVRADGTNTQAPKPRRVSSHSP